MLGQVALQRGRFIEARAAFLNAEQLKAKGGASSVHPVYKQQHRCVGVGGGGGDPHPHRGWGSNLPAAASNLPVAAASLGIQRRC
jgi:hypothetical protein